MKRMSNVFLAAAMAIGMFSATGCAKRADQTTESGTAAATDTSAAAQADAPAKTAEDTKIAASVQVQAPKPPALRQESPGRAPSERHVWQRGFWRYESPRGEYVWVPGHWEETGVRAPFAPPAPRFEEPGRAPSASYAYVPGYWRWDGREYLWVPGHWSLRVEVGSYYRFDYEYVNGQYVRRGQRWDDGRIDAYERERARERAEREARARAEREQAAREAQEKAACEARERAEREARERADREARERAEREAREQAEHAKNGHGDKGRQIATVAAGKPIGPRPPTVLHGNKGIGRGRS